MAELPKRVQLIAQLDLAAASGIVCLEQSLYVIADDLLTLAVYDLRGVRTQNISLLPGELPDEHAARKAQKPDFEALLSMPDGSVLVLGSGSTQRRQRAVWVQDIATSRTSIVIDMSELYTALARELPELNIEGGAVFGAHLYLCSRGNGARRDNTLVELDLERVLAALQASQRLAANCLLSIQRIQLPELEGVPLSLTDLAVHGPGLVFSAAAEASANTYDDGACAGSVVGKLSADGTASDLVTIATGLKLEGICSAGAETLYAVADADDANAQAPLLMIEPW
ncbi:MAG TPA: hypothetical protein VFN67_41430 [Polyangiales bacterium]|nr:hypothetical protein [Polyangiales bacterium]